MYLAPVGRGGVPVVALATTLAAARPALAPPMVLMKLRLELFSWFIGMYWNCPFNDVVVKDYSVFGRIGKYDAGEGNLIPTGGYWGEMGPRDKVLLKKMTCGFDRGGVKSFYLGKEYLFYDLV